MKPEEQRIAIAEACGWKPERTWLLAPNRMYGERPEDGCYMPLPDYLNSLDAMHGAVETLRGKAGPEWLHFQWLLMIECDTWMNCIQASAAQRAEAFLKTLSLWKDDD